MMNKTFGVKITYTLIFLFTILGLSGCGDSNPNTVAVISASTNDSDSDTDTIEDTISIGMSAGSQFQDGVLEISQNGDSWNIDISIVDENSVAVTTAYPVTLNSTCVTIGQASFNSSTVETVGGKATVIYTNASCSGIDVISASTTSPEGNEIIARGEIDNGEQVVTASSSSGSSSSSSSGLTSGMNIAIDTPNLDAGASTNLTVTFLDADNELISGTGTLTANSPCASIDNATLDQTSTTSTSVTFSYTATGCTGDDPISISGTWNGDAYSSSATINVAGDTVSFLRWVSAEPPAISIKNAGGNESSTITFSVNGQSGEPIIGETITFRVQGEAGGLTLVNNSDVSDNDGLVQARVRSGTTPTNVTIIATHAATGETVASNGLVVATGLAADQHFNIALDIHNPLAFNKINDQSVTATVAVTDKSGNPVADGTVVNFVSEEGGAVDPSCTTVTNTCSVTWRPNGRNPADGRIQVFATVKGTENYIDNNGNKLFDDGDTFDTDMDLAEPYSDNNDNDMYDVGEHFVDSNADGSRTLADSLWNGLNCQHSTLCNTQRTFVDLGTQITVHATQSAAEICNPGNFDSSPRDVAPNGTLGLSGLYISDANNNAENDEPGAPCPTGNPLPVGTEISFTIDGDATLLGTTSWVVNGRATRPVGAYAATVKGNDVDEPGSALLILKVTLPDETVAEWSWNITVTP